MKKLYFILTFGIIILISCSKDADPLPQDECSACEGTECMCDPNSCMCTAGACGCGG